MTGRERIVQVGSIGEHADALLRARYDVLALWQQADPAGALARDGAGVRVLVTSVRLGCRADLIDRLPSLQAICSWGVGHETLDVAHARARGVQVSSTPDVLDDCVADLAFSLLLAAARRTVAADRYVRDGHWREIGRFPLAAKVSGKRLGLLGIGRIGRAIARRATGFGMTIRYHARRPHDVPWSHDPSLAALAGWADFLVVACSGGEATRGLVSREVLAALGPDGILVNIARGSVIDQAAMVEALATGRLGGAGLDVFDGEPAVPVALRQLDNVVMTPHIGSATRETRREMERLVVDNVASFIAGRGLLTPVR